MKNVLGLIGILLTVSSFPAAAEPVCSQLINHTGEPLNFLMNSHMGTIKNGESSSVFNTEAPSKYQLRDGEITVYLGGAQITENGQFNMQAENADIPANQNCSVFYQLHIYQ